MSIICVLKDLQREVLFKGNTPKPKASNSSGLMIRLGIMLSSMQCLCVRIVIERYYSLMGETVYAEIIKCYPSLLGAVTLCLSCYSESDRFDERQDRMLCSAQISNLDDKRNDIVSKTTSLDMRIEAVRKNAL